MNRWIYFLLLIMLISSCHKQDVLVGEWKINSQFYSATYQIEEEGNGLNGLVLFYDDGTTTYVHEDAKPRYAFTGLKKNSGSQYVDGVSGATTKNSTPKSIEIKRRSHDTLEVTTYMMKQSLTEIWTRK